MHSTMMEKCFKVFVFCWASESMCMELKLIEKNLILNLSYKGACGGRNINWFSWVLEHMVEIIRILINFSNKFISLEFTRNNGSITTVTMMRRRMRSIKIMIMQLSWHKTLKWNHPNEFIIVFFCVSEIKRKKMLTGENNGWEKNEIINSYRGSA